MKKEGEKGRKRRNDKERYVITWFCAVEQNWNLVAVTHKEK